MALGSASSYQRVHTILSDKEEKGIFGTNLDCHANLVPGGWAGGPA
jgi:hypothetical protein